MILLSFNNCIQYRVSLASLREILILWRKSLVLCACYASRIKAPTAVPERKSCLDKTNSLFSEDKC